MKSVIWVIGAGNEDKDLVPLMINDGVMIIGPGNKTGDLSDVTNHEIKALINKGKSASSLISFKNRAKQDQIVILRLGSVCFAVGAIESQYYYDEKYCKVYSYWNTKLLSSNESPWDLQHTRDVEWYVLNKHEAIHYFRKGIYGSPYRFYRLGSGGKGISKRAKKELDNYLISLEYNNKNAKMILSKIGKKTTSVNSFGFPC